MNEQEKVLFEKLSKEREIDANVLDKPALRGVKNSVVEKYSDQAHFIYELLQNADDAFASEARFVLKRDRLIFVHNGSRLFSVSDVDSEDSDSDKGCLGDINAITSIANSNKREASIGKFGVGFKAVFQYTSTPHIYDPNFKFKISRFIVPIGLNNDCKERNQNETAFVFPFDHPDRNAEESYRDISEKLKNLSYPLLFLSHLKYISYEYGNIHGLYDKKIRKSETISGTSAEQITLSRSSGHDVYKRNLWLFSRVTDDKCKYSVGFFLDKKGRLTAVNHTAFCFFPTKEVTQLKFIIHAPFLLTDSREGIRAGVPHNERMISLLAELAADSLIFLRNIGIDQKQLLINDDIFDIIPVNEEKFSKLSNKSILSFLPFYTEIKKKFETEALLLSANGYVKKKNAYWASVVQITKLFTDSQLEDIVENPNAHWVLLSKGRDDLGKSDSTLRDYIDSLLYTSLNEDVIIKGRTQSSFYNRYTGRRETLVKLNGISARFIEKQPISWLHMFYKWISETKPRTESIKKIPVFLSEDNRAVAAYNVEGEHILFLPEEGVSGYTFLHPELLKNAETRSFIEQLGIKHPSIKDQIYNAVIPLYRRTNTSGINYDAHFKLFFKYYCQCAKVEVDEFIKKIRECPFICYRSTGDNKIGYGTADSMYFPTNELKAFLFAKSGVRFVQYDMYKELVGESKKRELESFLSELGVHREIQIVKTVIKDVSKRKDLPCPRHTRYINWGETIIDGGKELIDYIVRRQDKGRSLLLWDTLVYMIESHSNGWHTQRLSFLIRGTCYFFYRVDCKMTFHSSDEIYLKKRKWLLNNQDEFVSPQDVSIYKLSTIYDVSSDAAKELIRFLEISTEAEDGELDDDNSNLSEEQRKKLALAEQLENLGFGIADVKAFLEYKKRQEWLSEEPENNITNFSSSSPKDKLDRHDSYLDDEDLPQNTKTVVTDIIKRTKTQRNELTPVEPPEDSLFDEDDYTPIPVDYSKSIERAKQKSAREIERIASLEELQNQAISAERYSFRWFKILLEMECKNYGEISSGSKEVSINFGKVEKEIGTKRTLILRNPSRYIPQFMEDLADIPLVLHFGDKTKTLAIEVANIQSYTLRVKLKSHAEIEGIDLSTVTSANIDAQSPSFLLEELKEKFFALEFDDDYNMRDNLCKNIEFVFGPPGTGKTTHIAKNILMPMMQGYKPCRVLVLTPTNKAADVIVHRIMELSGTNRAYENWLIRFGATGDEFIEESPVFRDKTFDITSKSKSVTVTTIARFPYDFFMPLGKRLFLDGINWDYIIVDEASMISLAYIIYPLFKKTPTKFIVAGDPFQIEPITSIDMWKNENIYTMVKLNSFVNPSTIPYNYKVELLTMQYRSIPVVGEVFSKLTYGGVLKHYRTSDSLRALKTGSDFSMKALNIIKFPVSKYESIYKPKRLQSKSNYQVYSALFTYEFACYLSRILFENNQGKISIGIIAPYRAQADLIDKLLSSEKIPDGVEVQTGTIHGFQGDECDIILTVFNPPPSISATKEMFLNKKNIINVSISRAKDYLFVIMPDNDTDNVQNLRLLKQVERLIKSSADWKEYSSSDLERIMFGNDKYLEENAFSTGHQSVNVYGLPEMRYEIRTEDAAVDVQIHKGVRPKENVSQVIMQEERTQSTQLSIKVKGRLTGKYALICYEGKLRKATDKATVNYFIPIESGKKYKLIPVSVAKESQEIFIAENSYQKYGEAILNMDEVEIRKTYLS